MHTTMYLEHGVTNFILQIHIERADFLSLFLISVDRVED